MNKTIEFPLVFLEADQQNYYSRFSRGLSAITDRLKFGISWDLNPVGRIVVEITDNPNAEDLNKLKLRIARYLIRKDAKGVIAVPAKFKQEFLQP